MSKVIGKVLYGSQNYKLDLPDSDKDYKVLLLPTARDMYDAKMLRSVVSDHENGTLTTIDIRHWLNLVEQANPNAIELLYSVEQDLSGDVAFFFALLKANINKIIRTNLADFYRATKGLYYQSQDKALNLVSRGSSAEQINKHVARAMFYNSVLLDYQENHFHNFEDVWTKYRGFRAVRHTKLPQVSFFTTVRDYPEYLSFESDKQQEEAEFVRKMFARIRTNIFCMIIEEGIIL